LPLPFNFVGKSKGKGLVDIRNRVHESSCKQTDRQTNKHTHTHTQREMIAILLQRIAGTERTLNFYGDGGEIGPCRVFSLANVNTAIFLAHLWDSKYTAYDLHTHLM